MQAPIFCASCTTPLAFKVPDLTGEHWHAQCGACGKGTALEANPSDPREDRATFRAVGVYPGPLEL